MPVVLSPSSPSVTAGPAADPTQKALPPPPDPGPVVPPLADPALDGLSDGALRQALRERTAAHTDLGYLAARQVMFKDIDSHGGQLLDVYTDRQLPIVDLQSSYAASVNTEHTWPKSLGVVDTPAESDLHHLFPTDEAANRLRANYPFGEVETVQSTSGPSMLGLDAAGQTVFEPPPTHKGDAARALFYVATVYDLNLPDDEEAVLRGWNAADPVDAREAERNAEISQFQGNRNVFVDSPELVDRIHDF